MAPGEKKDMIKEDGMWALSPFDTRKIGHGNNMFSWLDISNEEGRRRKPYRYKPQTWSWQSVWWDCLLSDVFDGEREREKEDEEETVDRMIYWHKLAHLCSFSTYNMPLTTAGDNCCRIEYQQKREINSTIVEMSKCQQERIQISRDVILFWGFFSLSLYFANKRWSNGRRDIYISISSWTTRQ